MASAASTTVMVRGALATMRANGSPKGTPSPWTRSARRHQDTRSSGTHRSIRRRIGGSARNAATQQTSIPIPPIHPNSRKPLNSVTTSAP